jgi:hypothetical protein
MNKSILTLAGTVILTCTFMSPSLVYGDDDYKKQDNYKKEDKYKDDRHDQDKRDEDRLVCYKWDKFPDERFKLNVKKHSPLSEKKEEQKFDHPRQTAFSVHGKQVISEKLMATVQGTVVIAAKASRNTVQTGAHLGLYSTSVRGDRLRPLTIDCTTDEISSTPDTWTCEGFLAPNEYLGYSKLIKVDETKDPTCSFFEDGKPDNRPYNTDEYNQEQ